MKLCRKLGPVALATLAVSLSGCSTMNPETTESAERLADIEAKIDALDEKINRALRNSSTAKIDASTALHIAQQAPGN